MLKWFRQKVANLSAAISWREPARDIAPPRTGTDASSIRHMWALIIGTAVIMVGGLIVAFLEDDDADETAATPIVVVTPTAPGDE